jgi:hypothetical protein
MHSKDWRNFLKSDSLGANHSMLITCLARLDRETVDTIGNNQGHLVGKGTGYRKNWMIAVVKTDSSSLTGWQIAMLTGFATFYPAKRWLLSKMIKESM